MPERSRAEHAMYAPVTEWLRRFMASRFPRAEISVEDTHNVSLSRFVQDAGIQRFYPEYQSFDVKVDVVGLVRSARTCSLVLVECKINPVNLRDVGQLLGYSLVVQPAASFLISPRWWSGSLRSLLETYERTEVLRYGKRAIRVCKWDPDRQAVLQESVFPRGPLL